MRHHIKHLTQRDGIFYYSRRFPKAVMDNPSLHQYVFGGGRHYRISLRTADQVEALGRFKAADAEFNRKLLQFSSEDICEPSLSRAETDRAHVGVELLTEIKQRVVKDTRNQWFKKSVTAEISHDHASLFDHEVEWREKNASVLKRYLTDPSMPWQPGLPNVNEIARHYAQFYHIQLGDNGNALAFVKQAVRSGLLQGERAVDQILEYGAGDIADLAPPPIRSAGPRLSEIFDSYLSASLNGKTRREAREVFKKFVGMTGDVPANEVDHSAVRNFCKSEASTIVGAKGASSIKRPIKADTIKKKLSFIRSAFERAISRGELDEPNPVGKINLDAFTEKAPVGTMPDKRPFRPAELAKIFAYPWFTGCKSATTTHSRGEFLLGRMYYWAPIMAALTGMRLAEIAGLKISEIKIDDRFPHIEVMPNEFRSTKNGKRRLVPIIRQLDELGFSNFVHDRHAAGDTRLFEDIIPSGGKVLDNTDAGWGNAALFRAFNRTVVPAALELPKEARARLETTFHGFRGAFKTMLSHHDHGISELYILDVVGHSKPKLDKSYRPEIPIEDLYSALLNCRYQGFEFPRLLTP